MGGMAGQVLAWQFTLTHQTLPVDQQVTSVENREWQGSGPDFTLLWGGREWSLNVHEPGAGLRLKTGESLPRLLSLDRLAAPQRSDSSAFTRETLVAFEKYRTSIRATYAPPSWGGIQVRAAWIAAPHDAVDFELQLSASSVGELQGVEVDVKSRPGHLATEVPNKASLHVEARDSAAAEALRDGRDPDLQSCECNVLSVSHPLRPSLHPAPDGPGGLHYVEIVHPDDLFWRVLAQPTIAGSPTVPGGSVRYALFGLELEKGVILRARLRGQWFRSTNPGEDATALYQTFMREPPPLGP